METTGILSYEIVIITMTLSWLVGVIWWGIASSTINRQLKRLEHDIAMQRLKIELRS